MDDFGLEQSSHHIRETLICPQLSACTMNQFNTSDSKRDGDNSGLSRKLQGLIGQPVPRAQAGLLDKGSVTSCRTW